MANDLHNKYPGREKQLDILLSIIPESKEAPKFNSFVIEGPPSTGKTTVLLDVLRSQNQSVLLIDCYECYSPALLYSKILDELFGKYDDYLSTPVGTFFTFFSAYRKALKQFNVNQFEIQYIVFKHFDNVDTSVISDLRFLEAKFPSIWRFCSIFIVTNGSFFEVYLQKLLKIHFSRYTKDQLRDVLLLQRTHYPSDIYQSFLQIFIPWIFETERNLRDLLRLADLLFPIFKKPVDEKKISLNEPQMLYNKIKPYLQKYSDTSSLLLFNRINCENLEENIEIGERFSKIIVDLPYYTKYLLLAAYLASYISSKDDRQLFCRRALKKRKKRRIKPRTSDNEVNLLTGPKPFPLNRLLAIYFSIVEERSNITATLLSQIASLVELKLLLVYGKDENIDEPYYKCVARPNLVQSVAKNVNFDLKKFFFN